MDRHAAPGSLEVVRVFLNTLEIPNETRRTTDLLGPLMEDREEWEKLFAVPPPETPADREALFALRDDLRAMLEPEPLDPECLNAWLAKIPICTQIERGDDGSVEVSHVAPENTGLAGLVLAAVVEAIAAGRWSRLKACQDCIWVFYDQTRNASRVWCSMYAQGDLGRACGTIAKVRRYRRRHASAT
jgi:predicted RNA-binding Zn ribbon-like protein